MAATKAAYDAASERLETLKLRLRDCNSQIAALGKEKDGLASRLSDLAVERKKLEHKCGSPFPSILGRLFTCCTM